jgi:DNA polymerase III subunit beta
MKLSIKQSELLPTLQAVARSCGVRSTLPVLANILLQTDQGKLKLSATNLELGVVKTVNADITTDGEITVPSRTFLEIISSLTDTDLELDATADQMKISAKNFSATLNCIPATEFPSIPLSTESGVMIDAQVLKQALPQISFAAAADEGRPILTGILTEIKKDSLELVATDGFRLAHKTAKVESTADSFKALIPRRTLEEVVRLISEEEDVDKIEISTSENQNQMIFKINQTQLSSRLIEGQFPSWEKIIPQTTENRTIVDRGDLLKAVKLASVFAKDSANIIKLKTGEKQIVLTSEAKELGGQETEVLASIEGPEIFIAFNSKFLSDALAACASTQVAIEFSGNLSAALIKPIGEEGLEYVIMPVRLS